MLPHAVRPGYAIKQNNTKYWRKMTILIKSKIKLFFCVQNLFLVVNKFSISSYCTTCWRSVQHLAHDYNCLALLLKWFEKRPQCCFPDEGVYVRWEVCWTKNWVNCSCQRLNESDFRVVCVFRSTLLSNWRTNPTVASSILKIWQLQANHYQRLVMHMFNVLRQTLDFLESSIHS